LGPFYRDLLRPLSGRNRYIAEVIIAFSEED
jgi:hypothetical protein